MDHKITFRLSDEEYDTLKIVAGWYKNNKSKAIRHIIQHYKYKAILTIPTRDLIRGKNESRNHKK